MRIILASSSSTSHSPSYSSINMSSESWQWIVLTNQTSILELFVCLGSFTCRSFVADSSDPKMATTFEALRLRVDDSSFALLDKSQSESISCTELIVVAVELLVLRDFLSPAELELARKGQGYGSLVDLLPLLTRFRERLSIMGLSGLDDHCCP